MISEKLQSAINGQISAEMWSANLYLSMSFYFDKEGLPGFAHWMRKQYFEEMQHACELANYVIKRGGTPKLDKVAEVPFCWESPLAAFEEVYKHECHVSKLIDQLVDVASADKDKASQDFLWTFVREQVEEESTVQGIIDKMKRGGEAGLLIVDSQLAQR
ncbi:MAG: ferritin [Bacteroides sp.]|nr:ferritin [Bacteroides sp.]